MRNAFANAIISNCEDQNYFFLTGDLGFMALEGVQASLGKRFINVGVAEQNMIGVAAGLAKGGYKVFTYSIAPFCYARPFEQIRNDLCFSKLPVCIVGNGGGYAYGHMGPTHHALEDCAAMNALGVKVLVPSFNEDILAMISNITSPTYLRLGRDTRPNNVNVPTYSPWRKILSGGNGVMVALGPLAGTAWEAFLETPFEQRPSIWAVTDFSPELIDNQFLYEIKNKKLYIIEEHVESGGLGMIISLILVKNNIPVSRFIHRTALRYPTNRFGSQSFHQKQCGLDIDSIKSMVEGF